MNYIRKLKADYEKGEREQRSERLKERETKGEREQRREKYNYYTDKYTDKFCHSVPIAQCRI